MMHHLPFFVTSILMLGFAGCASVHEPTADKAAAPKLLQLEQTPALAGPLRFVGPKLPPEPTQKAASKYERLSPPIAPSRINEPVAWLAHRQSFRTDNDFYDCGGYILTFLPEGKGIKDVHGVVVDTMLFRWISDGQRVRVRDEYAVLDYSLFHLNGASYLIPLDHFDAIVRKLRTMDPPFEKNPNILAALPPEEQERAIEVWEAQGHVLTHSKELMERPGILDMVEAGEVDGYLPPAPAPF